MEYEVKWDTLTPIRKAVCLLLVWPILVPSMVAQRAKGLQANTAATSTSDLCKKPVDFGQIGQHAEVCCVKCSAFIARPDPAASNYP